MVSSVNHTQKLTRRTLNIDKGYMVDAGENDISLNKD